MTSHAPAKGTLKLPKSTPLEAKPPGDLAPWDDGRSPSAKRIAQLIDQRKQAERTAAEQAAIAAVALQELKRHPDVYADAAPRIFVAAAHALAAGDLLAADTLPGVLAQLSAPAAAWIFADVSRARVLVELARRPEKLAALAALPAVEQAMALGVFVAELEAARRPVVALYGGGAAP